MEVQVFLQHGSHSYCDGGTVSFSVPSDERPGDGGGSGRAPGQAAAGDPAGRPRAQRCLRASVRGPEPSALLGPAWARISWASFQSKLEYLSLPNVLMRTREFLSLERFIFKDCYLIVLSSPHQMISRFFMAEAVFSRRVLPFTLFVKGDPRRSARPESVEQPGS